MLKFTKIDAKRLKLSFAMFEDNFCTSIVYGFAFTYELPVNKTDPFFFEWFPF